MERADYYEAKAAIQNMQIVQMQAQQRIQIASAQLERTLARLNVPIGSSYSWSDETHTITTTPKDGE